MGSRRYIVESARGARGFADGVDAPAEYKETMASQRQTEPSARAQQTVHCVSVVGVGDKEEGRGRTMGKGSGAPRARSRVVMRNWARASNYFPLCGTDGHFTTAGTNPDPEQIPYTMTSRRIVNNEKTYLDNDGKGSSESSNIAPAVPS